MLRILVCLLAMSLLAPAAWAKAPKKYQVTGTVLEVTDTTIVVQKGDEKWELARDASTKVSGKLAAGEKVTIEYQMNATSVEVKSSR
jgi:hypothetical protein